MLDKEKVKFTMIENSSNGVYYQGKTTKDEVLKAIVYTKIYTNDRIEFVNCIMNCIDYNIVRIYSKKITYEYEYIA